jgi:hypothetical protein
MKGAPKLITLRRARASEYGALMAMMSAKA